MVQTQRATDVWLTVVALALLVLSPVQNAFASDLPRLLPTPISNHAPVAFSALILLIIVIDIALILLRRALGEDPVRARSRALWRWNSILTVGLGVIGAATGILSNLVVPQVPELAASSQAHQSWVKFLLPLSLLAVLICLPLVSDWASRHPNVVVQDRDTFLTHLTSRYETFLDDRLQHAVRAQLNLVETPAALLQPEFAVETHEIETKSSNGSHVSTIARDKSLLPIFDTSQSQLLILGNPGAGKSNQLYKLGLELVKRAQGNPAVRIPVILDLSTWSANKDTLERWLVEELAFSYRVAKGVASDWVERGQVLPLLDALDVMKKADRPDCIAVINSYLEAHPTDPLVVCCRREGYDRIDGARLNLQRAVMLQPLSDDAIDQALSEGGASTAPLLEAIRANVDLRNALRTPLILSISVLAFGDLKADEIPPIEELNAWRHQLFRRYVSRMLLHVPGREKLVLHFSEKRFLRTLAWLGHELREHDINTFYIEGLQIGWLTSNDSERRYRKWLSNIRLGFGMCVGCVACIGIGLGIGLASWLVSDLSTGVFVGLGTGLVGAVGGLIGWEYINMDEPIKPVARRRAARSAVVRRHASIPTIDGSWQICPGPAYRPICCSGPVASSVTRRTAPVAFHGTAPRNRQPARASNRTRAGLVAAGGLRRRW